MQRCWLMYVLRPMNTSSFEPRATLTGSLEYQSELFREMCPLAWSISLLQRTTMFHVMHGEVHEYLEQRQSRLRAKAPTREQPKKRAWIPRARL